MPHTYKNEAHISGELAKDPVTRSTSSGKKVCTLSVATKYKQWTEYHRIVCWEATADKAEKLTKGEFVRVVGRLQSTSWDDKQTGQKRYTTEIVAFQIGLAEDEPAKAAPKASVNGKEIAEAILSPSKPDARTEVDDEIAF